MKLTQSGELAPRSSAEVTALDIDQEEVIVGQKYDGTDTANLSIYSLEDGSFSRGVDIHTSDVVQARYIKGGRSVVSLDGAGSLHVFDLDGTNATKVEISDRLMWLDVVQASALITTGRSLHAWRDFLQEDPWELDVSESEIPPTLAAILPNSSQAIVALPGATSLRIYDWNTTKPSSTIPGLPERGLGTLAVSPNGRFVVGTGWLSSGLFIWDLEKLDKHLPDELEAEESPDNLYTCHCFDAHTDFMAVGMLSGFIQVLDISSGTFMADVEAHNGRINNVAFDAEGRLVSGGEDGVVRIWDTAN